MKYWLIEHPAIVSFRWSPTQSYGATWWFLISAISFYVAAAVTLHLLLKFFRRRRAVPLGPVPALHSLAMALISAATFTGALFSAEAEARDTRWLWQRTRTTSFEWLLCFPLGTRPSGRVFFWSYVFYLSRFLHLLRTFFVVLRHRRLSFFRLFNNSVLLVMSFLWLEFSQSLQVLAILFSTSIASVVYAYRFWTEIGLPSRPFKFTANCQMALWGCNLVCHVGVLSLHYLRGGCNGIGAWVFNSLLNAAFLVQFLKSYVKTHWQRKSSGSGSGGGCSSSKREEDSPRHARKNSK
ncbi:Elongation of fatty acids protein 3 [Spatholobus suberectus]|nr:Elongation of fatty acids protein 3 [Spatholobus suberectus]